MASQPDPQTVPTVVRPTSMPPQRISVVPEWREQRVQIRRMHPARASPGCAESMRAIGVPAPGEHRSHPTGPTDRMCGAMPPGSLAVRGSPTSAIRQPVHRKPVPVRRRANRGSCRSRPCADTADLKPLPPRRLRGHQESATSRSRPAGDDMAKPTAAGHHVQPHADRDADVPEPCRSAGERAN